MQGFYFLFNVHLGRFYSRAKKLHLLIKFKIQENPNQTNKYNKKVHSQFRQLKNIFKKMWSHSVFQAPMLSFPAALVPFMTEMTICGVVVSHQLSHVIGLPVCLRNVLPLNSWTNLMNMQKEHLMPEPQIKQTNKPKQN